MNYLKAFYECFLKYILVGFGILVALGIFSCLMIACCIYGTEFSVTHPRICIVLGITALCFALGFMAQEL